MQNIKGKFRDHNHSVGMDLKYGDIFSGKSSIPSGNLKKYI